MTESQLLEYQNYIFARIRKLNFHVENLDTADNDITCTLINSCLEDIKSVITLIQYNEKHSK